MIAGLTPPATCRGALRGDVVSVALLVVATPETLSRRLRDRGVCRPARQHSHARSDGCAGSWPCLASRQGRASGWSTTTATPATRDGRLAPQSVSVSSSATSRGSDSTRPDTVFTRCGPAWRRQRPLAERLPDRCRDAAAPTADRLSWPDPACGRLGDARRLGGDDAIPVAPHRCRGVPSARHSPSPRRCRRSVVHTGGSTDRRGW